MQKYINEIITSLKKIDPCKIILFGSCALGRFSKDSDIDVAVILDNNTISTNYTEKMKNKLLVRESIYEISRNIPIDILVFSKTEFENFLNFNSSFSRELQKTGKIIYEKTN